MRTVDLIQRKRDGEELAPEEIEFLVVGYTNGEIPDYQMSAFLMAVYFSGMTDREVGRLTECMLRSGETVDMTGVPGLKVDKHSTGGVGDKTSFIVAPLAAAAGVVVPMMSGRALGHTGGTLDKLESIPGFRTDLSTDEFKKRWGAERDDYFNLSFARPRSKGAAYLRSMQHARRAKSWLRENLPAGAWSVLHKINVARKPKDQQTQG